MRSRGTKMRTKYRTTKTEATCCPVCGMKVSAATSTEGDHKPTPGDLSVCAYCATPLVFTDGLKLRKMTDLDMLALPFSELRQIRAAQTAVQRLQRMQ